MLGLALASGCGSDPAGADPLAVGPNPTDPTPMLARVVITRAGLVGATINLPVGGRVEFLNEDDAPHQIASDPHPAHSGCAELDLSPIAGADSAVVTLAAPERTCTYHDETDPTNPQFWGKIVLAPASP